MNSELSFGRAVSGEESLLLLIMGGGSVGEDESLLLFTMGGGAVREGEAGWMGSPDTHLVCEVRMISGANSFATWLVPVVDTRSLNLEAGRHRTTTRRAPLMVEMRSWTEPGSADQPGCARPHVSCMIE